MTRAEAAAALGLPEGVYAQLELGDALLSLDARERVALTLEGMPPPTTGELCAVARRRMKRLRVGMREIEDTLGISRPTMIKIERAGAAELQNYWKARGFTFPGSSE